MLVPDCKLGHLCLSELRLFIKVQHSIVVHELHDHPEVCHQSAECFNVAKNALLEERHQLICDAGLSRHKAAASTEGSVWQMMVEVLAKRINNFKHLTNYSFVVLS